MLESRGERFLDVIFAELCQRLVGLDIPVARATLHVRTLHPQYSGASMIWRSGMNQVEMRTFEHAELEGAVYNASPVKAIYEGAEGFRQRLDRPLPEGAPNYPIFDDLRQQNLSDYVVWPLDFVGGQRHVMSLATDRPGGFHGDELMLIADLIPAIALVADIRIKNRITRTLLDTYVGGYASEEILKGVIRRGSGMTVRAVITVCDLRGFTALSELWPRDDVIAMLNDYFDAMCEPVERNGGEILKFIGDGLLAIFPMRDPDACDAALRAAIGARRNMAALNAKRQERGLARLGYGLAVHVGDVMYGNIGSAKRLDFTVIGPAVNIASRLEGLSKTVHREILFSGAFVNTCPCGGLGLDYVGRYPLRGVDAPMDVWALPETSK
nr:adenylate/guanylate cyclase domain-containing protein [Arboricoccus pini]